MSDARRYPSGGHLAVLVGAAVLATAPFVDGRFAFFLDFVVGPNWDPTAARAYGFTLPEYGGSLPLVYGLRWLATVAGPSAVQKLVLVGVALALGLSAYAAGVGEPRHRLYAAILLLFNPFVYVRLLAGHWVVLWGLAALPLVLASVSDYLDTARPRSLAAALVSITLLGFSAHLLLAAGILVSFLVAAKLYEGRTLDPLGAGLTLGVLALPLNAYWLAPVLLDGGGRLSGISGVDAVAFSPAVDGATALLDIATMHGFWRAGYVYARDLHPAVLLLYVPLLYLATYGFLANYRDPDRGYVVKAVAATAVVALLLGAGVQGPAAPAFRWAFEHVPFFAGMRDSQKFVALLVLAYAYLGSLGLRGLDGRLRSLDLGRLERPAVDLGPVRRPSTSYDRGRLLAAGLVVLAVVAPVAYTFPMATGYAGQASSQDYPATWYEVQGYLADQPDDGAVLFLPWHQHMDYGWLESRNRRLRTPARAFFSRPVIQGDNVEMGATYSTSTNPVSGYVEFLFGLGPRQERKDVDNMGELLTHIDVKYVLVTREADWRYYDSVLRNQSDLSLVMENEHFRVYRNDHRVGRAFATDRLTYVEDLDAFVERSRREDTTDSVYVIDPGRAGEAGNGSAAGRAAVDAEPVHPARHLLDGNERRYTVFVQRQATYAEAWRFGGAEPTARHLGMSPVFESAADGETVSYEPFYRVFLPSYLVSLLALVGLVGWVLSDRRDQPVDGRGCASPTAEEGDP